MKEQTEEKKPYHYIRGGGHRIPEERYAAAKVLYESTPGITYKELAQQTGISMRALVDRSRTDGGWKKIERNPNLDMSEAAQAIADKYVGKLADYGMDITPDDKKAALQAVLVENAAELRAQLIERHRKEWGAIRNLIYKSIKEAKPWKDDDDSKRAKILAEALQITQSNERKAWGIEKLDQGGNNVTVVIERE